jgi:hypothetical protein
MTATATKAKIFGLTLYRPFGYAIAYLDKRIENRNYRFNYPIGTYIAIHNGKTWDQKGYEFVCDLNRSELIENPTPETDPEMSIIAIAQYAGEEPPNSSNPWYVGKIGWKLENVVPIDPVPCGGSPRLWTIPDPILQQVRINYREALRNLDEW